MHHATRQRIAEEVRQLHERVDAASRHLAVIHEPRLRCTTGCASCCIDDLTVLDVEAERIRAEHASFLESATPHPRGACAFLGAERECRIYATRPYVCRTQGLPLRWFEEDDEDEIVERRDVCELNDTGGALSELPAEDCWLIGPTEHELVLLQERHRERLTRVPLRTLFRRV